MSVSIFQFSLFHPFLFGNHSKIFTKHKTAKIYFLLEILDNDKFIDTVFFYEPIALIFPLMGVIVLYVCLFFFFSISVWAVYHYHLFSSNLTLSYFLSYW